MKKAISILLAVLMTVSIGFVMASADTLTDIDIVPNKTIEFDIAPGNKYVDVFSPGFSEAGDYIFISSGDVCPTVTISYVKTKIIGRDETETVTIATDGGILFDTFTFNYNVDYTFTVSAPSGGAFSMIFFKPDASKCGFVSEPDKKSYYENLEVSISGSTVTFLNDSLDLTGAAFNLVDSQGNVVYTVKDNALKKIISSVSYSNNVIKLSPNASKKIFGLFTIKEYASISLEVKPYPIRSVVLNHGELNYVYGEDGRIKGSLSDHYFIPDIKFDEMTATVTLKDGTNCKDLEIKSEGGRYYFEIENVGKVFIENNAQCPDSGSAEASVRVGATDYKLDVTIQKPDFFKRIGIFFKLLFGIYK